jgi:vacuolar protein sorting-associated protein 35
MYVVARKHFGQGGPKRIKYTLVPLVFRAMLLARKVKALEAAPTPPGLLYAYTRSLLSLYLVSFILVLGLLDSYTMSLLPLHPHAAIGSKKILGFVLETIKGLASSEPLSALRLFLEGALCGNACGEDKIAYEFVSQAFQLYEDDISDSKVQMEVVLTSAGTLYTLNCLDPEDYDTLITNSTKHAVRLLKKPDQCRAVYTCSQLFWNNGVKYEDGKLFQAIPPPTLPLLFPPVMTEGLYSRD